MKSNTSSSRSTAARPAGASTCAPSLGTSRLNFPSGGSSRSTAFAATRGTTIAHRAPYLGAAIVLLAVLGLGLGARSVVRGITDKPDVFTSYLTRECVRVVNADGSEGSCSNLPETYHNHWVD